MCQASVLSRLDHLLCANTKVIVSHEKLRQHRLVNSLKIITKYHQHLLIEHLAQVQEVPVLQVLDICLDILIFLERIHRWISHANQVLFQSSKGWSHSCAVRELSTKTVKSYQTEDS